MNVLVEIKIESGNAAFGETRTEALWEVSRVIAGMGETVQRAAMADDAYNIHHVLRDINGNSIGHLYVDVDA